MYIFRTTYQQEQTQQNKGQTLRQRKKGTSTKYLTFVLSSLTIGETGWNNTQRYYRRKPEGQEKAKKTINVPY